MEQLNNVKLTYNRIIGKDTVYSVNNFNEQFIRSLQKGNY